MLYDPKWEQQTKADPFELSSLIAWLEKQPANKTYCYLDRGGCLFHQYFTDHGLVNLWVGGLSVTHGEEMSTVELSYAFANIAACSPHTFGGALKRARAYARS